MSELFSIDWQRAAIDLVKIVIAFALALPLALDRARSARHVGLRTFPIVAVASCGFYLIARTQPEANPELVSRVAQGILTGIGFIGGGAILKQERKSQVVGLATAASIWTTGAIGLAVAADRLEIAVILSLTNFALLRLFSPLVEDEEKD